MNRKTKFLFLALAVLLFTACGKDQKTTPGNPSGPTGDNGNGGDKPPVETKKDTASIVIIGSSTAAGMGATPLDSSWANRVKAYAKATSKKTVLFENLAVVGFTTYHAMPTGYAKAGRPAVVPTNNITAAFTYHPTLVIVSFSSNDVASDFTDEEILANYGEITRLLDSAKVKYIVFGNTPRNFPDMAHRSRLQTMNGKIQAMYPSQFNNIYDTLATPDLFIKPELAYTDGIHLNNTGHYIVMQSVLALDIFKQALGE